MISHKSRTKSNDPKRHSGTKILLLAAVIFAIIQLPGINGPVSTATQWTLLKAGLLNADDEPEMIRKDFDYDFTIKDMEGNRTHVETLKGKVIFLNIWATWCRPCRVEMPGIQSLYNNIDKEKVIFVMLSIDKDSDRQRIINFLRQQSFTFPAYVPSGYLTEQLNVPEIPTTFIIARDGKIVKKEIGATNYDTPAFRKLLEKLAAE